MMKVLNLTTALSIGVITFAQMTNADTTTLTITENGDTTIKKTVYTKQVTHSNYFATTSKAIASKVSNTVASFNNLSKSKKAFLIGGLVVTATTGILAYTYRGELANNWNGFTGSEESYRVTNFAHQLAHTFSATSKGAYSDLSAIVVGYTEPVVTSVKENYDAATTKASEVATQASEKTTEVYEAAKEKVVFAYGTTFNATLAAYNTTVNAVKGASSNTITFMTATPAYLVQFAQESAAKTGAFLGFAQRNTTEALVPTAETVINNTTEALAQTVETVINNATEAFTNSTI